MSNRKLQILIYSRTIKFEDSELQLMKKIGKDQGVEIVIDHIVGDIQPAIELIPEADVLLVANIPPVFHPDLLWGPGKKLKWAHTMFTGYDDLLTPSFISKKLPILTHSTGIVANTISEFTLGRMLTWTRQLWRPIQNQPAKKWDRGVLGSYAELRGKQVTIFGVGAIGRKIGRLCQAFGMQVIGVVARDRTKNVNASKTPKAKPAFRFDDEDDEDDLKFPLVTGDAEFKKALLNSDFLILAAPLNKATEYIVNKERLSWLPPHACIVNIGRGALIDDHALIQALEKKQLGAALLDVFTEEPLPPSDPLWTTPNVFITPHIAGFNYQYRPRVVKIFSAYLKVLIPWLLTGDDEQLPSTDILPNLIPDKSQLEVMYEMFKQKPTLPLLEPAFIPPLNIKSRL